RGWGAGLRSGLWVLVAALFVAVIEHDLPGGAVEIIELAIAQGTEQQPQRQAQKQQAHGNQQEDTFHRFIRLALRVTSSDEPAMPRAAAQGAITPATASGTAIRL